MDNCEIFLNEMKVEKINRRAPYLKKLYTNILLS